MWKSQASLVTLKRRAQLLADCRSFFSSRKVLEVELPALGETGVTDPWIECFQTDGYSLQSSPEYFMKRLLASGCGDIYSLAKAFRKEEAGRYHSPEFTLLEWYRLGFDDRELANEVVALIEWLVGHNVQTHFETYASLFERHCAINPHQATDGELQALARANLDFTGDLASRSAWFDLIFTHIVEPAMGQDLWVVYDYPVCQAALARKGRNEEGDEVARRFEVYWRGVELANGYWELTDEAEQAARFQADLALRAKLGKPLPKIDAKLLGALAAGLPDCAGVALGIDRLLMCICELDDIQQVQTFTLPG